MEIKKLTAKEILTKIEEQGISVEDFGWGDFGAPEDFELSPETQKIKDEYLKFREIPWEERKDLEAPTNYHPLANKEWLDSIGIGEWEEVEQVGGEGEGDIWYSVKYFKDHDVYIKTTGFYSSYEGTEFYDGYGEEVRPKEKTITVYE